MLGDLILDYFDQKKVIKKSSEEFLRLYDLFELSKKSTPEKFKKSVNSENHFHISEILKSFYLIAYVAKSRNNKKLAFKSVFQKEEFFVQDIILENKDIRKVFTTEYKIIISALSSLGMSKEKVKLMIDDMHDIVIKGTRKENIKNSKETNLADFGIIATFIDKDIRKLEGKPQESIDNILKKLINSHFWG